MRFGKQTETTTLDDDGSTVSVENNIIDYKTVRPIRKRYEYRVRVADKKEEMTEYLKFSDSLTKDRLDPEFRLEYTRHGNEHGYYYVIKCWSTLEY